MAPYFETVKVSRLPLYLHLILRTLQSFADVPITADGVETVSFLEASDGLVNMFGTLPTQLQKVTNIDINIDLLGAGIFSFVQMDLRNVGNLS
jgi:hypothetical protein